jgi:hypothetical protein
MTTASKFIATPLLVLSLATSHLLGVAVKAEEPPAAPDELCDYCKDYTDRANSADDVRSAYRPGRGYAVKAEDESVAMLQRQRKGTRIRARPDSLDSRAGDKGRN